MLEEKQYYLDLICEYQYLYKYNIFIFMHILLSKIFWLYINSELIIVMCSLCLKNVFVNNKNYSKKHSMCV